MKRIMLFMFLATITLMMFTACSDDDNNNNVEPETYYGYTLDQFVPMEAISDLIVHNEGDTLDWRELFYFWPTATDFSPRMHGYDDLDWQDFQQGYYIPENNNKVVFPQFAALNIGAYNVKNMDKVYVSRGVRSIINDTLSVVFELNAMTTEMRDNYDGEMEAAIPLTSFMPEHVTAMDSVSFIAIDGYTKTYTPAQFKDGYWLVDTQKTIFPNEGANMSGSLKKFKLLKSMEFFGTWQNVDEYVNPAWANAEEADWYFSFPEDLSDYEGTVLE